MRFSSIVVTQPSHLLHYVRIRSEAERSKWLAVDCAVLGECGCSSNTSSTAAAARRKRHMGTHS